MRSDEDVREQVAKLLTEHFIERASPERSDRSEMWAGILALCVGDWTSPGSRRAGTNSARDAISRVAESATELLRCLHALPKEARFALLATEHSEETHSAREEHNAGSTSNVVVEGYRARIAQLSTDGLRNQLSAKEELSLSMTCLVGGGSIHKELFRILPMMLRATEMADRLLEGTNSKADGNRLNRRAKEVSMIALAAYEDLTGRPASRSVSVEDGNEMSDFVDFLSEVFSHLGVDDASAASQAKTALAARSGKANDLWPNWDLFIRPYSPLDFGSRRSDHPASTSNSDAR